MNACREGRGSKKPWNAISSTRKEEKKKGGGKKRTKKNDPTRN